MRTLLFLALVAISLPSAHASTILSDTADIARYAPNSLSDAKLIEVARNNPLFTKDAKYKFGLHLTGTTTTSARGQVYSAAALMSDPAGRLFYRKFEVTVGGTPRRALAVDIIGDTDLSQMHFTVNTGLFDRMVVVEDVANDVTLSFPLGVGGIDEAVIGSSYKSLTPKFQNATIDRKSVNPARSEPAYYRNRPFMAITTARGTVTAIAFHITILGDDEAQRMGLNYLMRGYESHGCMRMREKDLMEFFTIVMNGADEKLSVNVDNHIWNRNAQGVRDEKLGAADIKNVYPENNESFMRVTRFPEAPHYKRDDVEHLVMMDRAQGTPDFRRMSDVLNPVSDFLQDGGEAELIDNRFEMP